MLRLISYSSADSFIKRDYILDVIEKDEKNNFKFLDNHPHQSLRYDNVSVKMSNKKTIFVQHRREYYNDFEDCLRDYRQQNQKAKGKQSKVHHSDGDNNGSDSDYVDCTDVTTSDLRHQSTLSSKSLPHVPTAAAAAESYHETQNRVVSIKQQQPAQQQLSGKNYVHESSQIKRENAQLVENDSKSSPKESKSSHKSSNKSRSNNQLIDKKVVVNERKEEESDKVNKTTFVSEKSMTINSSASSLPKLYANELKKPVSLDSSGSIAPEKKDEMKEKKRKSCKKRQQESIKDSSQMKMTVTSAADNHKLNNLDDASWSQEREVTLERVENKSFGISIVGGKVNVAGDSLVSGIFIKSIIAGSAADKCGLLRVGDRILAVDGVDIRHSSHEVAVKTIKNAGDRMTLCVQSLNTGTAEENPIDFMKKLPPPVTPARTPIPEIIQEGVVGEKEKEEMKDDLKPMQPLIRGAVPSKKSPSNGVTTPENEDDNRLMIEVNHSTGHTPIPDTESEGSSDEDDDDTRDMEGKMHTAAGEEIDRASAGNVKRSKEEIEADPEKENEFGYTMSSLEEQEYYTDILLGIKQVIQSHLKDLQGRFQDKFVNQEMEIRRRDETICLLQNRLREYESSSNRMTPIRENEISGSTGSSSELPFMRGDSQDTIFFASSPPSEREVLSDKRQRMRKSFSSRQESSRSWDESSDPESFDSQRIITSPRSNNNNIVISNLTGNIVNDSVVVNIEDSEESTTSNESNSDDDDDDEMEMDEAHVEEEEDELHHNDWEVRMLAAELKKRESVSELHTASAQSSENDGLLRRRKRRSDTDTDASEGEVVSRSSRPRAASLDHQNLRKQQFKCRSVFKAMSFDRDKDQL